MRKPGRLRAALTEALEGRHPAYRTDPSLMHMVALDVGMAASGRPGTAFQYQYTLALGIMDFTGNPEEVSVPLLIWVQRWQHDLLTDPKRAADLTMDVEYLESGKVDLIIRLKLTEAVRFVPRAEGGHDVIFAEEPVPMLLQTGEPLHRVYLEGELIAACSAHPEV